MKKFALATLLTLVLLGSVVLSAFAALPGSGWWSALWIQNLGADDDTLRGLRGGSFYDNRSVARCAFRLRSSPRSGYAGGGFRVVVSPISSSAL